VTIIASEHMRDRTFVECDDDESRFNVGEVRIVVHHVKRMLSACPN
jgi:hypothetical protein